MGIIIYYATETEWQSDRWLDDQQFISFIYTAGLGYILCQNFQAKNNVMKKRHEYRYAGHTEYQVA